MLRCRLTSTRLTFQECTHYINKNHNPNKGNQRQSHGQSVAYQANRRTIATKANIFRGQANQSTKEDMFQANKRPVRVEQAGPSRKSHDRLSNHPDMPGSLRSEQWTRLLRKGPTLRWCSNCQPQISQPDPSNWIL